MSNPYDQNPDYNPYDPSGSQPSGSSPSDPAQNANPSPYGQPYGQQPPYGQNPYQVAPGGGYPYGQVPQPHPQGTTVLVLGIIGLVACVIPGIVAIVMGGRVLKEIDANPAAYSNRQNVQIGRILGIISAALWGVFIVVYGIIAIVAFAGSSAYGG